MGDAKRALQQYAEAFRRNSDDPYPLLAISGIHTHYRPANLTAAINYATRAIELRPGCLRAHAIRADAYFRSGETKLALRDVCRAQHLTPSSMTIMGLKAYYLQALGRTYDAAATCSALAAASCAHSKAATESASEEKKAIADAEVASMTGRRRMMPSGKDCGTSRSDLLKDSDCMNKQSSRDLETRSSVMVGGVPPAVRRLRHFTFEAAVLGPSIVQRLHVLQAEARLVSQSAAEAIQLLDGVLSVSTHNHDDPMRTALDQSMLAVARQIAGDLRGAHASMQVAHKLAAGAGPDHGSDWSTIWLRDGHLRLAMHDARGALASYGHARRSNPHSGLAHEAIGWARFTLRLQCETAQALGTAVNDKVPDQAEEGDSDEITCSEGDGEEVGGEEEATDEEGLEGMRRGSKVESLIEGRREVMPKVFRRRRRLQMNKELGAFRRANKLTKGGLLRARLHLAFVLHRDGQHSRAASELEKVTGGLHSAAAKAPEVSRELANILVLLSLIQLAAGQVAASMLTLREAIARGAGKLRQGPFRLARFAQGTTLLKLGSIGNAVACLKEVAASFDLAPITRRSTGMSAQPRATTNRSLVRAATAAQSGGLVSAAEMVRRPDALLAFAAHFNLGLALERQEAAAGASRAFSAALLLAQKTRKWPSPDVIAKAQVADCHIAHGMVLLQLARAREAAAQFDSALRLEPPARSKLQALLGLGHTRVDVGDVVGARRIYSRASLTFPREAAPCVALARLFHHSDKTAAALRSIATALELAPNHPDALEVRAAIRLSVRGTAGSIADLEACTSHSSDASEKEARPGRCITLAMVRMQIGEQKPARKEHSLLGHEDSDVLSSKELRSMSSARKLTAMGYHAAKRGEWEQSAALYDEASQLMAVASASLSGSTDGDTKGADYPASGTQRSNASGRVNPNAGEVDLGSQFELIPRPTSGCPSIAQERVRIISGRASFGAGLAYAFLGDFDIALVHFDQAVHFRPDCGFTMYNRALLHLTAQRWDLAEVDLKGCVERLPLMPDGWLKKSDAIIAQGNKGRMGHALSDYANALVVMDFDPRTRLKA
jgi:tetratricopeptide (TPR) repeat protein